MLVGFIYKVNTIVKKDLLPRKANVCAQPYSSMKSNYKLIYMIKFVGFVNNKLF